MIVARMARPSRLQTVGAVWRTAALALAAWGLVSLGIVLGRTPSHGLDGVLSSAITAMWAMVVGWTSWLATCGPKVRRHKKHDDQDDTGAEDYAQHRSCLASERIWSAWIARRVAARATLWLVPAGALALLAAWVWGWALGWAGLALLAALLVSQHGPSFSPHQEAPRWARPFARTWRWCCPTVGACDSDGWVMVGADLALDHPHLKDATIVLHDDGHGRHPHEGWKAWKTLDRRWDPVLRLPRADPTLVFDGGAKAPTSPFSSLVILGRYTGRHLRVGALSYPSPSQASSPLLVPVDAETGPDHGAVWLRAWISWVGDRDPVRGEVFTITLPVSAHARMDHARRRALRAPARV